MPVLLAILDPSRRLWYEWRRAKAREWPVADLEAIMEALHPLNSITMSLAFKYRELQTRVVQM